MLMLPLVYLCCSYHGHSHKHRVQSTYYSRSSRERWTSMDEYSRLPQDIPIASSISFQRTLSHNLCTFLVASRAMMNSIYNAFTSHQRSLIVSACPMAPSRAYLEWYLTLLTTDTFRPFANVSRVSHMSSNIPTSSPSP